MGPSFLLAPADNFISPCANSLSWTRTNDTAVNSRMLYRLSYQGLLLSARTLKTTYCTISPSSFLPFNTPSLFLGQALDLLVTVSSIHYCTSTSALSTSSSSRGLTLAMGYLILRGASRLDAFSVYPFPTWLPGHAIGMTTGTPEVSPSRSSRTEDSSSQISSAHAG